MKYLETIKCPCGSKKKYKKCFLINNSTCVAHQQEDEIINFFMESLDDLDSVFKKDSKNNYFASDRAKLIVTFTIIDICYTFWEKYNNILLKQSEGFINWTKKFIFVEENEIYKNLKTFEKITTEQLYQLRCASVHFCGIPEKKDFTQIMIIDDLSTEELIMKIQNDFNEMIVQKQITIQKLVIIRPIIIKNLIKKGVELMLEKLNEEKASKPAEYITGIKRIYDEFQRRGVCKVPVNFFEKKYNIKT